MKTTPCKKKHGYRVNGLYMNQVKQFENPPIKEPFTKYTIKNTPPPTLCNEVPPNIFLKVQVS